MLELFPGLSVQRKDLHGISAFIKKVNKHPHNPSAANVDVVKVYTGMATRADDTIEMLSAAIPVC